MVKPDAGGYGFSLSGEQPVFVEHVVEGGPSHQAGIQRGDRIIRLDGAVVFDKKHTEVVEILKGMTDRTHHPTEWKLHVHVQCSVYTCTVNIHSTVHTLVLFKYSHVQVACILYTYMYCVCSGGYLRVIVLCSLLFHLTCVGIEFGTFCTCIHVCTYTCT